MHVVGNQTANSYWASLFWHQKMIDAFPWLVSITVQEVFDWPGTGQVLTIEPINSCLGSELGPLTLTCSLMLYSGALRPFPKKLGLFGAGLPPPLMSASTACSLIARTFVNLTLFPAELCRRMSLRHCQIAEHLGWKSQRHRHLERKWCLCGFPGKPGPDIYCEIAEPRWAMKNYLAQICASRLVNLSTSKTDSL